MSYLASVCMFQQFIATLIFQDTICKFLMSHQILHVRSCISVYVSTVHCYLNLPEHNMQVSHVMSDLASVCIFEQFIATFILQDKILKFFMSHQICPWEEAAVQWMIETNKVPFDSMWFYLSLSAKSAQTWQSYFMPAAPLRAIYIHV